MMESLEIRPARSSDVPLILSLIRELAEFERLLDQMVADENQLRTTLFGERPAAEVMIAEWDGAPAGFALYFSNYSTFLGQPGIYLEDLYVRPEFRGRGIGEAFLRKLAALAVERRCGRVEWSVLNWNERAIKFYQQIGARPMNEWTVYRLTGEALTNLGKGDAPR